MTEQRSSPHLSDRRTETASLHQEPVCDGASSDTGTGTDEADARFRYDAGTVFETTTPWGSLEQGIDEELWQVIRRRWRSFVSFAHGTDDEPSSETRAIYVLENRCGERRQKTEATLLTGDWHRVDIDLGDDREEETNA